MALTPPGRRAGPDVPTPRHQTCPLPAAGGWGDCLSQLEDVSVVGFTTADAGPEDAPEFTKYSSGNVRDGVPQEVTHLHLPRAARSWPSPPRDRRKRECRK